MQVVLAFHIIFMVCWFAGLFYLPRLYVYHVSANDQIGIDRFKIMEWKLYNYITTPAAILTTLTGILLLVHQWDYFTTQLWMHIKLISVLVLWLFHIYCGKLMLDLRHDKNHHSEKFFRFFNEVPTVVLFVVIFMVVFKPQ